MLPLTPTRITMLICIFLLLTMPISAGTKQLSEFGENPGALEATYYMPENQTSALVVLLHGCAQQAEWLADQTGLLKAAKAKGFVLLMPQQVKSNNMQLCFNWFSPEDHLHSKGETLSLMNMIKRLKLSYKLNETYLVGLSAGGAMVTSLMAQYPDEISATGVIAGVGYPCADNLVKALSCMKNGFSYPVEKMVENITNSSQALWPNLTIITGNKDNIVNSINSEQMAKQWQMIMATDKSTTNSATEGVKTTRFVNSATNNYVELLVVNGVGHGWPTNHSKPFGGTAAPFVLESPLSSTDHLISVWGL